MSKLNEPEILAQLPAAKGWERLGDMLVRTWQFASSRRALEFVNLAATLAERADHYPDITLSYRTVRIELSTHAAGGLTDADFKLAIELTALPTDR
jgi:4a-hydroxytetrahydrobiopterin dehydratase